MVDKLLLSFLALALGPLLVVLARRHAWSTIIVDSFCVVAISGFSLLHLLPECLEQNWAALPLALVGFLAPTLAERGLRRDSPQLRRAVLGLALLGMAAHDTLDGVFLHGGAAASHGEPEVTAWAVILHRIPEGVGIWWIVPRTLGRAAAALVMTVTIAATLLGFVLGHDLEQSTSMLSLLQALLAGSLLHVVFHAHIPAPRDRQRLHLASVAGAAAAAMVLWFVIHGHGPDHDHGEHSTLGVFLGLAAESAPALLFAYLLVGLCHAFLPSGWLAHMTRGSPLQQALRGVAIGLPLPVCSCGVVPIYRELVRQGAALSAAIAFLVATPELEITAVLLTWKLMGGEVALLRVGMAAVLALGVGMAVGRLQRQRPAASGDGPHIDGPQGTFGQRLLAAVRFGYGPAVDNTASWILMGLLLSSLLVPFVDPDWIHSLPRGIDVPIAALLGLPLYVCATGSTPLAAVLLAQGLSPGAVLALLLTGPATNVTTFGMLGRLHGKRVAVTFAAAMWIGTIGLGYLANVILPAPRLLSTDVLEHEHGGSAWLWLLALGALFAWSLLRQGVRPFLERLFESPANLAEPGGGGSCCATHPDDAHGHGHDHRHDHAHAHAHAHDGHADHDHAAAPKPAGGCCDHHEHP